MRISKLIKELEIVRENHGDIETQIQSNPKQEDGIINDTNLFVVPEEYIEKDGGWVCNLRNWPY